MKALITVLASLSLLAFSAVVHAAGEAIITGVSYAHGVCNGQVSTTTNVANPNSFSILLVGLDVNIFQADGPIQFSYVATETGAVPIFGAAGELHYRAFYPSGTGFVLFPGERGSFSMACNGGGNWQAYITGYTTLP
jgi:hypothetical protein